MELKLGKLDPEPIRLKLGNYIDRGVLPPLPASFGPHVGNKQLWGTLANDRYGCCVWAGAAHETMMDCARVGKPVRFTDENVLSDYAAVTGFNPHTGVGDNGTVVRQAAEYRRTTGIVDANGVRHKIRAYLDINPGTIEDLWYGIYLFGKVGIGFKVPSTAFDQFRAGQVWDVLSRPGPIKGGHYVPLVDRNRHGTIIAISWGKLQGMTTRFYQRFNDESVAYVSEDALVNNRSPEGFDVDTLIKDLNALGG